MQTAIKMWEELLAKAEPNSELTKKLEEINCKVKVVRNSMQVLWKSGDTIDIGDVSGQTKYELLMHEVYELYLMVEKGIPYVSAKKEDLGGAHAQALALEQSLGKYREGVVKGLSPKSTEFTAAWVYKENFYDEAGRFVVCQWTTIHFSIDPETGEYIDNGGGNVLKVEVKDVENK